MNKTTPPSEELLIEEALRAQKQAYAPYSQFNVGAAVFTNQGHIFAGANLENATYGATVCAERNAIAKAVFAGQREIQAIAIATSTVPPNTPCGICLQVLAEFATDCKIILVNEQGDCQQTSLSALFPSRFSFLK